MKPVPPPEVLLCERCGYPLSTRSDQAAPDACPECGEAAPRPADRAGPAWSRRMSVLSLLFTLGSFLRGPRAFFRRMDPTGGPGGGLAPRLYLLFFATLAGCAWTLAERWWIGRPPVLALGHGIAAGHAVIALTYLEVLGVSIFSRLRGWRVPPSVAEQVACYASPAWLPGVAVALVANRIDFGGGLGRALAQVTGDPLLGLSFTPAALALTAVFAVLPFESVVHRGVRQMRFANTPASGPSPTRGRPAPRAGPASGESDGRDAPPSHRRV